MDVLSRMDRRRFVRLLAAGAAAAAAAPLGTAPRRENRFRPGSRQISPRIAAPRRCGRRSRYRRSRSQTC
jgi:hypothetical protein